MHVHALSRLPFYFLLVDPPILDQCLTQLTQPVVSGDVPFHFAVRQHGVRLRHPEQREEDTTVPTLGPHGKLYRQWAHRISVKEIYCVEFTPVDGVHVWLLQRVLLAHDAAPHHVTSIPGAWLAGEGGATRGNQVQRFLVLVTSRVERPGSYVKLHVHFEEHCPVSNTTQCLADCRLREAGRTILHAHDAVQSMYIHQELCRVT